MSLYRPRLVLLTPEWLLLFRLSYLLFPSLPGHSFATSPLLSTYVQWSFLSFMPVYLGPTLSSQSVLPGLDSKVYNTSLILNGDAVLHRTSICGKRIPFRGLCDPIHNLYDNVTFYSPHYVRISEGRSGCTCVSTWVVIVSHNTFLQKEVWLPQLGYSCYTTECIPIQAFEGESLLIRLIRSLVIDVSSFLLLCFVHIHFYIFDCPLCDGTTHQILIRWPCSLPSSLPSGSNTRYSMIYYQNTVIVVSGESGRQVFFSAKGLDLTEGFKILSGAVCTTVSIQIMLLIRIASLFSAPKIPSVSGITTDLQSGRIATIHKRVAAAQREDHLSLCESRASMSLFESCRPLWHYWSPWFLSSLLSLTCDSFRRSENISWS